MNKICKKCDKELSGKQTSFCSIKCSRRYLKSCWQKRKKDVVNLAKRKWRAKTGRKSDKSWYNKYPEKHKAHSKLRYAIIKGELIKKPCFYCSDKNVQAHHYDYSKPLDVIWLCIHHHNQVHQHAKNS